MAAVRVALGGAMLWGLLPGAAALEPGITAVTNRVYLMENHSASYLVWHSLGVTNATVVHVDAHDDCRAIAPEKLQRLQQMTRARDYESIHRLSDPGFAQRFEVSPSQYLFDLGNYVYPCLVDGTVSDYWWVVPDATLDAGRQQFLMAHLKGVLKLQSLDATAAGENGFWFPVRGARFHVTTLDELPRMPPGTLLDFDIDSFSLTPALTDQHVPGRLPWRPEVICDRLESCVSNAPIITIASSVPGGFLPLALRFIADACKQRFTTGRYPEYARNLLEAVETMRMTGGKPGTALEPPGDPAFTSAYLHVKALTLLMDGRCAEALDSIGQAAGPPRPVYAKGYLDASEALLYMQRPSMAATAIDRFEALQGLPTEDSLAARVRVCLETGDTRRAEAISRRLIEWNRQPHFMLLRGGVLTEMGRFQEASEMFGEVLERMPNHALAVYDLGLALERQGKTEEAVRCYQRALQLRPGMSVALENLGHLMLAQGAWKDAEVLLREAVGISPGKVSTLNNLGLALFRQEKFDEAVVYFLKARDLNAGLPEVHLNLGRAFLALGKREEARAAYRECLRLRPGQAEIEAELQKTTGP
jgi:Flp pilus assembly protein TadD